MKPQLSPETSVLLDLAERCERATGPDRELDAVIDVAVRGGPRADFPAWVYTNFPTWRARPDGRVETVHLDGKGGVHWEPRAYTASIDAAMTLVPPHHLWELKQGIQSRAIVWMLETDYDDTGAPTGYQTTFPAIALCAAALRASAALRARSSLAVQGE